MALHYYIPKSHLLIGSSMPSLVYSRSSTVWYNSVPCEVHGINFYIKDVVVPRENLIGSHKSWSVDRYIRTINI